MARRKVSGVKAPPEPDVLYRVFRISDGRPAYMPVPGSRGLPLEEAQRLSDQLAVPTEVREVWRAAQEDAG